MLFHLKSSPKKGCLLGGFIQGFNSIIKVPSFTGFVLRLARFQVLYVDLTMFSERRETLSFLSLFKNEKNYLVNLTSPLINQDWVTCPPLSQSQAKEMRSPRLV